MIPQADAAYREVLTEAVLGGDHVQTRGAWSRRALGLKFTFDRAPLISARRAAWKNALREMEWFLSGSNNLADLHPAVRDWWRPWAGPEGVVRNNYAVQLRNWGSGFDQVEYLLDGVERHPYSRRNVITTWDTEDMADDATPITNCHGTVIQACAEGEGGLALLTYQRSADAVCGLPHNWIQYWALLLWLAWRAGRRATRLVWVGGDTHVYDAHHDLALRILAACGKTGGAAGIEYDPQAPDDGRPIRLPFSAADFKATGEYRPVLEEKAAMVV